MIRGNTKSGTAANPHSKLLASVKIIERVARNAFFTRFTSAANPANRRTAAEVRGRLVSSGCKRNLRRPPAVQEVNLIGSGSRHAIDAEEFNVTGHVAGEG